MFLDPARSASLAAVALAAAMCLASGAAVAGDYYLRGSIGLDWPVNTAFTDTDCASTVPAALYGGGTGGDGAPYRSAGEFETVPAVELGLGHAVGAFRLEVLVVKIVGLLPKKEAFFTKTSTGRYRTSRIAPAPFFVSSDMTPAVQAADLGIYCVN